MSTRRKDCAGVSEIIRKDHITACNMLESNRRGRWYPNNSGGWMHGRCSLSAVMRWVREETHPRSTLEFCYRVTGAPSHLRNIINFRKLCSCLRVQERENRPFVDRITCATFLPIFGFVLFLQTNRRMLDLINESIFTCCCKTHKNSFTLVPPQQGQEENSIRENKNKNSFQWSIMPFERHSLWGHWAKTCLSY